MPIRRCDPNDFDQIWTIINDGARAYQGVIPADRWSEPYMSKAQLQEEIDHGVLFWGYEENGTLEGVMGLQSVQDVYNQVAAWHQRYGARWRPSRLLQELAETGGLLREVKGRITK